MSWPAHRTPRYVWNRLKEWLWQQRNPQVPWLGPKAVATLEKLLQPHMQGIEFGAGRSTIWVAGKVVSLESWEQSPVWFQNVARQVAVSGLAKIDLQLVENTNGDWTEAYAAILKKLQHRTFDFVLVDTDHCREQLCLQLATQVKPGGFLMLDNANWYLPSASYAPNSRSYEQGPATAGWQSFLESVADWECIWTSSGVTDTAFFIRTANSKERL